MSAQEDVGLLLCMCSTYQAMIAQSFAYVERQLAIHQVILCHFFRHVHGTA